MLNNHDIAVIGGGPAGSTVSILLAQKGFNVCLIEKKLFPREVLCGEFLSAEVSKILKGLNLFDDFLKLNPNPINTLSLFFEDNKNVTIPINFQAYGIKRSVFDKFLLDNAIKEGVKVFQPCVVENIHKQSDNFLLETFCSDNNKADIIANTVICAYGKTSVLDKKLGRHFFGKRTLINGIKFHISKNSFNDFNINEIRMYLSKGIYCGINAVNEKEITICFLVDRNVHNSTSKNSLIELFFERYKISNPVKEIFKKELASETVYGTGNIYFGKRDIIENGIYMIGDAARVIAPLSGDGIGIAMESATILAEILTYKRDKKLSRKETDKLFKKKWSKIFTQRIKTASFIQMVLLSNFTRKLAFYAVNRYTSLIDLFIKQTRSKQKKIL